MRRCLSAFALVVVAMAACPVPSTARISIFHQDARQPGGSSSGAPLASSATHEPTSRTQHENAIQDAAASLLERGRDPVARYRKFNIWWPRTRGEYARMARYTVMLLTVVTQKREELPLARVYIRAGGHDVLLRKIASQRSEYDANNVAGKMFGHYREDAFYLVPGAALMRDGVVLADFSANRKGMGVVKLPTAVGQKRARQFPAGDPSPKGKPDPETLKALMLRNFPGFPIPEL